MKPSMEPGAITQGLFRKNLITEMALSLMCDSPAEVDSAGRVALLEQHLLLLLTLPGPEKGLGGSFPEGVQ